MAGLVVYATPSDLDNWMGGTSDLDAVNPLLRNASLLINRYCRNDVWNTDSEGAPTDPHIIATFRDATCAQVEAWLAGGYDPVAGPGGQTPRPTLSSIDGAQISYDTYLTNDARDRAMTELCPAAYEILRSAGLAGAGV